MPFGVGCRVCTGGNRPLAFWCVELIFLGTGTSAGVPAIGCTCAVCTSTDERDRRLRTSAALRWVDPQGRDRTVLIDTSPDLRAQALRHGLRRCDAILYTHNHVDHTFGLDEVRRFNVLQDGPIDIFAEAHTLAHLRRVYAHIFEKHRNVNDSFVASLIAFEVDEAMVREGRAIEMFGARFTPLRLLHGRLPVLGWRVDLEPGSVPIAALEPGTEDEAWRDAFPLAWCTDVSAIPPETWPRLTGLRTLVLDALRHRKHPTHLTLDEAVGIADRVGAARTYFVHMAHDLPHAATQDELPEGMFLAHDGLVIGAPGSAASP